MNNFTQFVVFRLDEQRYALPLGAVERIVRAAEITALPKAPAVVLGVVDVDGRVLPVFDTRSRCRLPQRQISPADQFLIARTRTRTVALVIDEGEEVIELPTAEILDVDQIAPNLEQVAGVVQLSDGLVLIQDLENFLSPDEERLLKTALEKDALHGS